MPALGAAGVALAAFVLGLFATRRLEARKARLAIAAAAVGAAFLPIGGVSAASYAVGVGGEPSVTTLLLLGATALSFSGGPELRSRGELRTVLVGVAAAALFLYPTALGLTAFDGYALGYATRLFVVALAVPLLGAWLAGRWLLFAVLALAVAFHGAGVGESSNLWDYLLDPWVSLYAFSWLLAAGR